MGAILQKLRAQGALGDLAQPVEALVREFLRTPVLGNPSSIKNSNTEYYQNARCYRPKFMLSYTCVCCATWCLLVLTLLTPAQGSTPLSGQQRAGVQDEVVEISRALRRRLSTCYGLDLELCSVQYLPCVDGSQSSRQTWPAVRRALQGNGARRRGRLLRAKKAFLGKDSNVWAALCSCSTAQRARVFRELDLASAASRCVIGANHAPDLIASLPHAVKTQVRQAPTHSQ